MNNPKRQEPDVASPLAAALRRECERMRLAGADDALGVICVDAQRCIFSLNSAARSIAGWADSDTLGKKLDDVYRVLEAAPTKEPRQRAAGPDLADAACSAVLLNRSGRQTIVEGRTALLCDEQGAILGAMIAFRKPQRPSLFLAPDTARVTADGGKPDSAIQTAAAKALRLCSPLSAGRSEVRALPGRADGKPALDGDHEGQVFVSLKSGRDMPERTAEGVRARDTRRLKLARLALKQAGRWNKAILDNISDAFLFCDREWRYVYVNPAAARLLGRPKKDLLGRVLWDVFPEALGSRFESEFRRSLDEHVPAYFEAFHAASNTWAECHCYPSRDGLSVFFRDITARKRDADALRQKTALLQMLQEVTTAANEASTIEEATQTALNAVCAYSGWELGHAYVVTSNRGPQLLPTGIWAPERAERFAAFCDASEKIRFRPHVGLIGEVFVSGKPGWTKDVGKHPSFLRAQAAKAVGIRSALAFPVLVGSEVAAVLEFFSTESLTPDQALLDSMTQVGTQLGRIVERARRQTAEAKVEETEAEVLLAQRIHRKLFPVSPPQLPGYDVAALSRPALATGGDYFDYIRLSDGSTAFIIGDVSGHGFGPALMMSQARAYLRALALSCPDVSELLTRANQILAQDTEEESFITLFCVRFDTPPGKFTYAAAGHEAYLLRSTGKVDRLPSTGIPLGVLADTTITAAPPVVFEPGDLLLCFTDGISETEGPDGAMFGVNRVLELVAAHRDRSASEIVDALHRAVHAFSHPLPQRDDITAMVIKAQLA